MPLRAFVVIPMLNEAEVLSATCASLGAFRSVPERHFVLVDNGSTDDTFRVATEIQAEARHRVLVAREDERGHVPARRKGCDVAREYAKSCGWSEEDILICQADADTHYDDRYVEEIVSRAAGRLGVLYEGRSVLRAGADVPPVVQAYLAACAAADEAVQRCLADEQHDVIVDDKVAAYHLADYYRWGGHRREYLAGGELLAETTRLFLRALAEGAKREYVNTALAEHSLRRVLAEYSMHFASAGFPREEAWRRRYRDRYPEGMLRADSDAVRVRWHHLVGLFGLLPVHVATSLGIALEGTQRFETFLPKRTIAEIRRAPGIVLADVLDVIDRRGDELVECCTA